MGKALCPKHGEYEEEVMELFGQVIKSGCPLCEQEMDAEEDRVTKETTSKAQRSRLMVCGIEPEYFNAKLEDYKPENETEKKALEASRDLEAGKIRKLLLIGAHGTGKTMLACCLAQSLGGIRTTMFELGAKIRHGYSCGKSELDILDSLLCYPFICLDEVGRSKGSDAEKNWLSYLIDKAHTRNIRLMIISNRQTAKTLPADRRGEAIECFFDNDVISRLKQNSRIVEVKGRDRRAAAYASV